MKTSSLGSYNVVNAILAPTTGLNVRGLLINIPSGCTGALTIQDTNNTVTTMSYIGAGSTVLPISPSAILGITSWGTGNTMTVYGLK